MPPVIGMDIILSFSVFPKVTFFNLRIESSENRRISERKQGIGMIFDLTQYQKEYYCLFYSETDIMIYCCQNNFLTL